MHSHRHSWNMCNLPGITELQAVGSCNSVTPPWPPQSSVTLCSWSHGWSFPQLSTVTHLRRTFIWHFCLEGLLLLPSELTSPFENRRTLLWKLAAYRRDKGQKWHLGVPMALKAAGECYSAGQPLLPVLWRLDPAHSRHQWQQTAGAKHSRLLSSGWAGARQGSHTWHRISLAQCRACWERGTLTLTLSAIAVIALGHWGRLNNGPRTRDGSPPVPLHLPGSAPSALAGPTEPSNPMGF